MINVCKKLQMMFILSNCCIVVCWHSSGKSWKYINRVDSCRQEYSGVVLVEHYQYCDKAVGADCSQALGILPVNSSLQAKQVSLNTFL